jgi:hypothetical protein
VLVSAGGDAAAVEGALSELEAFALAVSAGGAGAGRGRGFLGAGLVAVTVGAVSRRAVVSVRAAVAVVVSWAGAVVSLVAAVEVSLELTWVVSDAGAAPERWSPLHPKTARRRRTPAVEGWSPTVIERTLSVFGPPMAAFGP